MITSTDDRLTLYQTTKFGAFVDNKINVTENLKFVMGRVENIVGKAGNAGYQHFLLFSQCFQKASFTGLLKVAIVWLRVNPLPDDKILDWSKLKQFADDILKYILNEK